MVHGSGVLKEIYDGLATFEIKSRCNSYQPGPFYQKRKSSGSVGGWGDLFLIKKQIETIPFLPLRRREHREEINYGFSRTMRI